MVPSRVARQQVMMSMLDWRISHLFWHHGHFHHTGNETKNLHGMHRIHSSTPSWLLAATLRLLFLGTGWPILWPMWRLRLMFNRGFWSPLTWPWLDLNLLKSKYRQTVMHALLEQSIMLLTIQQCCRWNGCGIWTRWICSSTDRFGLAQPCWSNVLHSLWFG